VNGSQLGRQFIYQLEEDSLHLALLEDQWPTAIGGDAQFARQGNSGQHFDRRSVIIV
jgi:hypothetical protein